MQIRGLFRAVVMLTTFAMLILCGRAQSRNADELVGCLMGHPGHLVFQDSDENQYSLEEQGGLLDTHIGDELQLQGVLKRTPGGKVFHVTSFKTVLRKSTSGVQPNLGDPRDWKEYRNSKFGIAARIPHSFSAQDQVPKSMWTEGNFAGDSHVQMLKTWSFPAAVYPGSNFQIGYLAIYVAEDIRSEGTCAQFAVANPKWTSSRAIAGVRYWQTASADGGMGRITEHYHLHTFRHGTCFELRIDLDELDGTGLMLPCSMQWVNGENQQRLVHRLLEQVSFSPPQVRRPVAVEHNVSPQMASFTRTLTRGAGGFSVVFHWSSANADYVQMQYTCIRDLSVSIGGVSPDGLRITKYDTEIGCGVPI